MSGRLEVIVGSMWSGKSEELIRRLRRHQFAGRATILCKPAIDNRRERDFSFAPTVQVHAIPSYYEQEVIGIDEIQLLSDTVENIQCLTDNGKIVIVAGLDMTYRREPFGDVPALLAIADKIDKLDAICHKCGANAIYTQRLIDGKPAPFAGETIQVGGSESYQARCRDCFQAA